MTEANRRLKLPVDIETEVLIRSRRRCSLCYGLHGIFDEKIGQIAHIDQNRSNQSLTNLVWLCFEHHSIYDSTTSQHKNYQPTEIKCHRDQLYRAIATSSITGSESIGRYVATDATSNVIRLPDRVIVIFDWPLRCTPTLYIYPRSLNIGHELSLEQWTTRGFQLVLRKMVDTTLFAFFADAAPGEFKDEAKLQCEKWKEEVGYDTTS
jgi:hypothetical protein